MRIGEEPSRALLDSAILRVKAASPWPRTVCESAGERWHNGAGSLPDLGYPVTPMLVCMLAWAVDGTDFRASRSGGESEPAAAHSLNGCGRAMAQRRGQFAGPWVSGHTDACKHIGAGGRRNRFRASRSGGGSVRDAAHGLGEWPRAMARRRRLLPDLRISAPSVVARILVRARGDRFSTIDERGRRCLREPAHAVGEWPRAMARRRRLLPDLRISAATMLAGTHIGVGARHDRFSTIDERGQRCLREPAHALRE